MVEHPRDWKWCGYHELMGLRQRYRLLDLDRLVARLKLQDVDAFRAKNEEALAERIRNEHLRREPVWTESIAVGAKRYVENAMHDCTHRRKFEVTEVEHGEAGVWSVREARIPYD